jgi:hypothetical protein
MQLEHENWYERDTNGDSVVHLYKHNSKPLLLRIDRIENLDGIYYKTVLKVTRDHDRHAHKLLFETPILDTVSDATSFGKAIQKAPMRYGRKFFKEGKISK